MRRIVKNVTELPEEKIQRFEAENTSLQIALAESIEKQANDKLELQLALAEVIENLAEGGA